MRLWTFQNKVALSVLDKSVWYSTKMHRNRVKPVDEKFIQEVDGLVTLPIYCFAAIGNASNKVLNLRKMYQYLMNLENFMVWDFAELAMFELEVPEDVILSAKKNSDWYFEIIPETDDIRIIHEDEICTSNFMKYLRNQDSDIEALITELRLEHIAAVRVFEPYVDDYDTCEVRTIYTNEELAPAWTETIYINGDGRPRVYNESTCEYEESDIGYAIDLQRRNGMSKYYNYMSIADILLSCDSNITDRLLAKLASNGLSVKDKQVRALNILEAFPEGI